MELFLESSRGIARGIARGILESLVEFWNGSWNLRVFHKNSFKIFEKEMRHLLEEKRKSRLSILGQDQNESLEKKIFF